MEIERVLVASLLIAAAAAVAFLLERRRPPAPTRPRAWPVPTRLDRRDFPVPDRPWLVVAFTSTACDSCARVTEKARVLRSNEVGYVEVSYQERKDLHERYGVDVVPMLLVADGAGEVRASFVGVPTATDLWAAVAEARQPGSSPEPHLGRPVTSGS